MTANAETAESSPPRSIHVSGMGKAFAPPDKADLTLAVAVQAKTADAARKVAAEAMQALIDAVKNVGVAEKDIQTSSVALYPNYSEEKPNKIAGYQLTNQVTVCIRNINKASDIIDAAVQAGGNATRVQGIAFGIENAEPVLSQARIKAYASARTKAEEYATLAGVNLAAPLHITESNSSTPMPYGGARMMKAAMADGISTPVQSGDQELTVNVDVVFGIR